MTVMTSIYLKVESCRHVGYPSNFNRRDPTAVTANQVQLLILHGGGDLCAPESFCAEHGLATSSSLNLQALTIVTYTFITILPLTFRYMYMYLCNCTPGTQSVTSGCIKHKPCQGPLFKVTTACLTFQASALNPKSVRTGS